MCYLECVQGAFRVLTPLGTHASKQKFHPRLRINCERFCCCILYMCGKQKKDADEQGKCQLTRAHAKQLQQNLNFSSQTLHIERQKFETKNSFDLFSIGNKSKVDACWLFKDASALTNWFDFLSWSLGMNAARSARHVSHWSSRFFFLWRRESASPVCCICCSSTRNSLVITHTLCKSLQPRA